MGKLYVFTGPESTAKSIFARWAALYFKVDYIPEYARVYLNTYGLKYDLSDLLKISVEQMGLHSSWLLRNAGIDKIAFVDTDSLVLRLWWLEVYGYIPPLLDEHFRASEAHYFLCRPDLPYEEDEQRSAPDLETRQNYFDWQLAQLEQEKKSFSIVEGNFSQRAEIIKSTI